MDYLECMAEITALEGRGIYRGLDRMQTALRLLKNPQDSFPTLHIAGTNGKGSTAAMIAEILSRSHFKTGLTVSPHVEDYRERIQVGGQWISRDDLVRLHLLLKKRVGHLPLTYFEWTTLIAFLHFAQSRVDLAVLETGMGGRWDATNVSLPLVGGITNVSLDHEEILGKTPQAILEEKMQILKPGMIGWADIADPSLRLVLARHCAMNKVSLFHLADYFRENADGTFSIFDYRGLKPALKGRHQLRNAAMAVAMVHSLSKKGFTIARRAIEEGLKGVKWPARLEVLQKTPLVLVDGAHNRAGIVALADYLRERGRKYHIVFGALNDRPFEEMVELLLPFGQSFAWAQFDAARAFSADELGRLSSRLGERKGISGRPVAVSPDSWKFFLEKIPSDEAVLVTGSLYLVSQIRSFYKKEATHA